MVWNILLVNNMASGSTKIALVPSCIIFTQALQAGSSNSILDGSFDVDASFTNFMNNVMNITYWL